MATYSRPQLEGMTVVAIKQFCRDRDISGYSRYTRKADLIEFVNWTLDGIEEMPEEDLLADPISVEAIATTEIHPDAIATGEIHPDAIASIQPYPDLSADLGSIERTDRSVSPAGIPEASCKDTESILGESPGNPLGIPRVSCEYPRVMRGLCSDYEISMRGLCADHPTAMIDRYPEHEPDIPLTSPDLALLSPQKKSSQVRELSQ